MAFAEIDKVKKPELSTSHSDTPPQGSQEEDSRWLWIAGLMVFFGVLILLSSMRTRPPSALGVDGIPKDLNKNIGRHLKETDLQQRYHEAVTEQQNDAFYDQSSLAPSESGEYRSQPMRISPEEQEKAIAQEQAEKDLPMDYRVQSLDQKIYRGLALEQYVKDYDEKYREEYVRAFLENARKAGYIIRLNKKLEIVDIQPANDDRPLRIPQSVSGTTNK